MKHFHQVLRPVVNNLKVLQPFHLYMTTNPISVFQELIVVIVVFVRGMRYSKSMIKQLQGTPTALNHICAVGLLLHICLTWIKILLNAM